MSASQTQTIRTMCPMHCHPTLCGMLAEVDNGRLLRVTGDKDNPEAIAHVRQGLALLATQPETRSRRQ